MAQRLEAALRRPKPQADQRARRRHAVATGQDAAPSAPEPMREPDPIPMTPQPVAADEDAPPAPQPPTRAAAAQAAPQKSVYDSLEQEMASLLGRPNSKDLKTSKIGRCVRLATVAAGVATALAAAASPAVAQDISINFGQGGGLTERVIQLIALLTVLSLAPSILVMMTSFTRIVVVLSLLRTALGTATAPPNAVIVSLALFLTAFVMGPALQTAYDTGIQPLINNEITVEQAFERAVRAAAGLHAEERAREGPRAVRRPVARAARRRRPRRCRCASWCRPS